MKRRSLAPLAATLAAALLGAAACAGPSVSDDPPGPRVVATTTILADFVRRVGGERVAASALVPPGGEVHTFDPRPSDVGRLSEADLVVRNGVGLDDWLVALASDANPDARLLAVGEDLEGVTYRQAGGHHHEEEDDADAEEEGGTDPHLWLDAAYAALYVDRIAEELARVDPAGGVDYRANADAYIGELEALDTEIGEALAGLPHEARRVVSLHDAFGYFADAYGLEVVGTVLEAPGQDPSAGEVAALIDAIRGAGAAAILAEAQFPDDLARQIAAEVGIEVVRELHSDSLGPPPADSYLGMMRANVARIVEALR